MTTLLTKQEAAQKLRISLRTLDRHVEAKAGPPVTKIGSRILFSAEGLEDWIRKQQVSGAAGTTGAL
jgi:excisionase family DNA binding protein